jgi:hypothetical protein
MKKLVFCWENLLFFFKLRLVYPYTVAGVHLNVRAATLITHRLQRIVGYASQQHAALTVGYGQAVGGGVAPRRPSFNNGNNDDDNNMAEGSATAACIDPATVTAAATVAAAAAATAAATATGGGREERRRKSVEREERREGRRHRRRVDSFLERSAVLGFFRDQPLGISICRALSGVPELFINRVFFTSDCFTVCCPALLRLLLMQQAQRYNQLMDHHINKWTTI